MLLYDIIKDMPVFEKFSEQEKRIFSNMDHSFLAFNKGDRIITEGGMFSSLYLIIKGSVLITKTDFQAPIGRLGTGQIFGEMSFLSDKPRYSNVIAAERVFVLKMEKSSFNNVDPVIKEKIIDYLIELLIKRLDGMNDILLSMANFARGHLLP